VPNIAGIFKQEITRLSRKEIRIQTRSLRKASVQARKDIAELKGRIAKLQVELKRLLRPLPTSVPTSVTDAEKGKGIRFRTKGLISQRKRLGISAADFGKLIGVTGVTVYNWEHGAAKPRKARLTALAALRGVGKREAMVRLEQLREKAREGK